MENNNLDISTLNNNELEDRMQAINNLKKIIIASNDLKTNDEIKSFNLVINGIWGSGKSTLIKAFLDDIKITMTNYKILEFNAWDIDYSDDPISPLVSFLNKKQEIINSVGIDICNSFAKLFKLDVGKSVNLILNKFEKDFFGKAKKIASQTDSKILFIIDDLDRCSPKFAIKLFELLKHFVNHPNIILIALFDWEQMNKAIGNLYGLNFLDDREYYLDKIFDYKWDLPKLSKRQLIEKQLNKFNSFWLLDNNDKEIDLKKEFIDFIHHLFPINFSIREINRIINQYKLSYIFMKRNIIRKNSMHVEFFIFYLLKNNINNSSFTHLFNVFNDKYLTQLQLSKWKEEKFIDYFWNLILNYNLHFENNNIEFIELGNLLNQLNSQVIYSNVMITIENDPDDYKIKKDNQKKLVVEDFFNLLLSIQ